jgi:hypothetical protein
VKLTLTTSKLQTRKERFNNEMAKTKLMKVIPATINQANNYYVVVVYCIQTLTVRTNKCVEIN